MKDFYKVKDFYYENKDSGNFLIFSTEWEDELDAFTLGMLSNNTIPGLLPVRFVQINNNRQFMYNVTAKVSLKQYMSGQITKTRCIDVFRGIARTALSCSEFMLDSSTIIFDPDYIFIDVSTKELSMVCLPTVRENQIPDLKSYFKQLLSSMLFSEEENLEYPARILNILNGKGPTVEVPTGRLRRRNREEPCTDGWVFSPERFVEQLESLCDEEQSLKDLQPQDIVQSQQLQQSKGSRQFGRTRKPPDRHPSDIGWDSGFLELGMSDFGGSEFEMGHGADLDTDFDLRRELNSGEQKRQKRQTQRGVLGLIKRLLQGRGLKEVPEAAGVEDDFYTKFGRSGAEGAYNFGETTFLGGNPVDDGTMLLSDEDFFEGDSTAYLLRKKTDEVIKILGDTFKIGKEKKYVDYCIENNPTVSRSHADIIRREKGYYIIDNNSTNHTYLNGEVIPNCKETLLQEGCKLVLGNEEFSFHCGR